MQHSNYSQTLSSADGLVLGGGCTVDSLVGFQLGQGVIDQICLVRQALKQTRLPKTYNLCLPQFEGHIWLILSCSLIALFSSEVVAKEIQFSIQISVFERPKSSLCLGRPIIPDHHETLRSSRLHMATFSFTANPVNNNKE